MVFVSITLVVVLLSTDLEWVTKTKSFCKVWVFWVFCFTMFLLFFPLLFSWRQRKPNLRGYYVSSAFLEIGLDIENILFLNVSGKNIGNVFTIIRRWSIPSGLRVGLVSFISLIDPGLCDRCLTLYVTSMAIATL